MSERFSGSNTVQVGTLDKAVHGVRTLPATISGNPRPPGLDAEIIQQTMRMVLAALRTGNQGKAIAAVNRAFEIEPETRLNMGSHISQLGMDLRTSGMLEAIGISTVRQLANMTPQAMRSIRGFGSAAIEEAQDALRKAILGGLTDEPS